MTDQQNASEATADTNLADIASTISEGDNKPGASGDSKDNVGDFKQHYNEQLQKLQTQVEENTRQTDALVGKQQEEILNKEIRSAAESINESAGGDIDMAETFLETQYRKDPNLKKIWDNRAENPEALEKALDVLGKEWAAKNTTTVDPQIAENQRALQASQRSGDSVQVPDENQKLDNMSDSEFLGHMRALSRSG